MVNKKRQPHADKNKHTKKNRRKNRKTSLAEFKRNLLLLLVIIGISGLVFFVRTLFPPFTPSPEKVSKTESVSKNIQSSSPVSKTTPTVKPDIGPSDSGPEATKPFQKPETSPKTKPPTKQQDVSPIPAAPVPEKPIPQKCKGTLIFVFDDAGHNLTQLQPFLGLPFPCTIAVLPGLQYSSEAAKRIRAAGKEVILHQPMQALNLSLDPGPDAVQKGMTADQIRFLVRKNLAELWPVSGMNNHEGSLITEDKVAMGAIFDVVQEKDIYYLDSRTTAKTVAPELAQERGMNIWERSVFLDNSQEQSAIIESLNSGLKLAERKGAVVMIGHIWSNDLASILQEMYPELVDQGFSLSTISEIATNGDIYE